MRYFSDLSTIPTERLEAVLKDTRNRQKELNPNGQHYKMLVERSEMVEADLNQEIDSRKQSA